MRQGKYVGVVSILAILILVLAACAPAATPTPTATPPPVVATPTATPPPGVATPTPLPGVVTPTPTPVLGPSASPQYGGIYWAGQSTPPYWDCHRTLSVTCSGPASPVFSSLLRFNPYAEQYLPQYIEGDLAERWEVSADGLVYTFYLRQGVKFHDGKPFTAKDVKYSLEKLKDAKRSNFPLEFSVIDRVDVVDDYTVKVYLKNRSGLFLPVLAQGMSAMQAEHLKDVNFRTPAYAIGTGPFVLKSVTTGVEMVYEKNPDFWWKGHPYLDGIRYVQLEAEAGMNAFLGGKMDTVGGVGLDKDQKATIKRFSPDSIILTNPAYPVFRGPTFNFVKEGPWQDARVRRAMTIVLDFPGGAIAAAGELEGSANHKAGYFSSAPIGIGLPWPEYEKAWWLSRPIEERVAEAKRLLAQAGYPSGFKGDFLNAGDTSLYYRGPSLLALDLWKKHLNIDLKYEGPERGIVLERREQGNFSILFEGFGATLGDPEQYISTNYVIGGTANYGKYSHPKVEELFQLLRVETDFTKRTDLVHQVERILMEDIPLIPMYKWTKAVALRPYIRDFKWQPFHSYYYHVVQIMWFDKNDPAWAKRGVGK